MLKTKRSFRNIAIIAHVDHGKTTLIDHLLRQSGTFRKNQNINARIMDSNEIEKERGITIFSKNCSIEYNGTRINIIDTPGHADFGGEVERILSMVDNVLLLIDAVEGPMPQTRFVTRKALKLGFKPIVVVNKIDRSNARPEWVVDATFDLFDKLCATEEQLDFPVIYTSALHGYANENSKARQGNMIPLFEAILKYVPVHKDNSNNPLQLQIISLEYSSYLGKIGIGRILSGRIKSLQDVVIMNGPDDKPNKAKINQIRVFKGLDRVLVNEALSGDIVLITGIEEICIGSTICDPSKPNGLPMLNIDEPTLTINFMVNNSPLAGREGKFITTRQIKNRLDHEIKNNIGLRVTQNKHDDSIYEVSGRGELHLTILIENMRREGYELSVSRPRVIFKTLNGELYEPYENLFVDIEEINQGIIMQKLNYRGGDLKNIEINEKERVRLEYRIPSRGLIGFQNEFITLTRGTGLISHVFEEYAPFYNKSKYDLGKRRNGVLISQYSGKAVAYSLWKLQDRGRLFINHNDLVYEGMIIGIHSRDNDLLVNPIKEKQLTNIRSSGSDEAIQLISPIKITLEYAIEFINDDELVEITPKNIRLRKRFLKENERKKKLHKFT
ncbi:translational GTPase TypA [Candidatus Profftella armatura]|jgi:GTP-binding protein TypA/BipA|uniref:Uncharacterized protein LOC113471460 n=2 Tax=cellular organisms TaxID=131567 RepID=A0A3Q0JH60_DIACI|nr:translational GTPase TypA [Candidatus Profftella armatura]XP_026686428.1 uncharacterized protein LOC113471460 [Diaphorina citri]XP_026686429.1 uncharacterized protein LOC113471461 [Diaphorina citri]AGS06892.1 GTP-binding elongation factor [Candidatus Profftella armatura]ALC95977.1 GTP-binding protein [Candidatus Profftella armatura]QLK13801.1 translational GTPase TypA [Candidatus Profftella armatura]